MRRRSSSAGGTGRYADSPRSLNTERRFEDSLPGGRAKSDAGRASLFQTLTTVAFRNLNRQHYFDTAPPERQNRSVKSRLDGSLNVKTIVEIENPGTGRVRPMRERHRAAAQNRCDNASTFCVGVRNRKGYLRWQEFSCLERTGRNPAPTPPSSRRGCVTLDLSKQERAD